MRVNVWRLIVFFIFLLYVLPAEAQSDMQLSQHMLNRMHYNPAVTGASRYVNISGFLREQWQGWKGAPRSQMITAHNYFNSINSGLGLVFFHDQIGLERCVNVKFNYAYHVKLSDDSYLSLGLGAGMLHRFFDRGDILSDDVVDDNLPYDIENKTYPDFDFGIEFNNKRFRGGVSVTHLTHPSDKASPLIPGRHYYVFLRYTVPVNFQWELEPSWFIQDNRKFIHSEVNVMAYYNRNFWFGASLRADRTMSPESFIPIVGLYITKFLRMSYSYDINLGKLRSYSEGTHELTIGIRIRKDPFRYSKSPRFFE